MNGLDDLARLIRLGLVLSLRENTLEPLRAAAAVRPNAAILVGASAHGRRLEVVMPYHAEALELLDPSSKGPGTTPPTEQPLLLRVVVEGDTLATATATSKSIAPDAAVTELAPPAHRDAWFELVDQFCSICDARITGRTRFVDGSRAVLEIRYPARDAESDAMLVEGLDQLAGDLGVSDAQRKLFRRVHPELGKSSTGATEISVATACTPNGVSKQLGITYPITSWELAIRLAQGLMFNDSEAAEVPTRLGQLAGALGSDKLRSVELVLGPHEPPDVIVWADLPRA